LIASLIAFPFLAGSAKGRDVRDRTLNMNGFIPLKREPIEKFFQSLIFAFMFLILGLLLVLTSFT
jgi:hypothetical protein